MTDVREEGAFRPRGDQVLPGEVDVPMRDLGSLTCPEFRTLCCSCQAWPINGCFVSTRGRLSLLCDV